MKKSYIPQRLVILKFVTSVVQILCFYPPPHVASKISEDFEHIICADRFRNSVNTVKVQSRRQLL